ncbi:hypothetical protein GCM10028806_00050 [Spirosoma terrae]|uniref:Uncharacterized protein n=1 Tax=Spirosoma terrae TaxID=1968276 RepID=A0A6L9LQI6_9BACT|nr:hypothetical protein [Spirosoma terrae]NDU99229.1 hypothetical protein [Spirosoma terrae]
MATKKDSGLKATLSSLGPKVPVKKTVVDVEKTEAATKSIHSGKKEDRKRQTVDLREDTFRKWKIKLINEGKTMQDKLEELVEAYVNQ